MAGHYRYRVWCNTENDYVFTWADVEPSVCPNNAEHTINTDKTAIIESLSPLGKTIRTNRNPMTNDDITDGYMVGNNWVNEITDLEYVLVDSTEDAAVWVQSGGASSLAIACPQTPTLNGDLFVLGWQVQTDSDAYVSSELPKTISEPAFHTHIIFDISDGYDLPFTMRITGMSINESTGVTTASDTEDISVTSDGYYQTAKSWVDAVQVSILEEHKACVTDIFRNTYWDAGNKNFTVSGCRLEWTPDEDVWRIRFTIYHVQSDGSMSIIDSPEFTNTDSVVRAARFSPGKYKRGDYNCWVHGSDSEGIILKIYQENIATMFLEVKYSA